jgi:hypothetical protein
MSTDYVLRKPLAVSTVQQLTGWKPWSNERGHGLTDGYNFVHTSEDSEGRIVAFTRYGRNDPSGLEPLNAVSEYDTEDPEWEKLFGVEEEA